MKNVLFRCLLSASLLLVGFYLGTFRGATQHVQKRCATFTQFKEEVQINATYALSDSSNQILAVFEEGELANLLKDPRLSFHECKK